jgi:DNA-binding MarR family transcriptional regulator
MSQTFDYREIDPIIHAPVRLGIMSILASAGGVDFNFLSEQLQLTDGNLSTHLRKLEEVGYVECKKSFLNRKPHSTYRILAKGRAAFERYVNALEKIALAGRKSR